MDEPTRRDLLKGAAAVAVASAATTAATAAPTPAATPAILDAGASDPVKMGWMVGAPPPADRVVRVADGSSATFPQTRWSFSHMRQLVPTANVARGGDVDPLRAALRHDLDAVSFAPMVVPGMTEAMKLPATMTWEQSLAANYTDGILVLHKGRIVYERYFGVLKPDVAHIAFSVTKSYVGTLGAMLVAEGKLDANAPVAQYVPELAKSGFGDATIRQVLDMRLGIQFSEDYTDSKAEIFFYSIAAGLRPPPPGFTGATNLYDFLPTVTKKAPHGGSFHYQTAITEVLAWVMRRATGQSLQELIGTRFWAPLGMEHDAYLTVDALSTAVGGGGLNATLRDQARFGQMMLDGGKARGQQIVPKVVVDEIAGGGDAAAFATGGYAMLKGGSYRNMWWVHHNAHGAYSARGIYGQVIYIDPKAEMVISRFASHPKAANFNFDPTSLPAYQAIAERLMKG